MKTTKLLTLALVMIAGLTTAAAQDNITVVLKDGTELTGYISRQKPGEDFTFSTSKAVVNLPSKDVKSIVDNDMKLKSLSPQWIEWAEENDVYRGVGDNKSLVLSDIITEKGTISRVRILEKGAKVRYLELTPNSYTLNWDTIQVVKAEKRPRLLLSGINRRYRLSSGMEYEGQYIEEVPGETTSLLCDNGVVEVIKTDDIRKDCRIIMNPNQTLFEQSDLLDFVKLKDNSSYRGVIIERNFSDDDTKKDFLVIKMPNGDTRTLSLDDIVEYCKEPNPDYRPETDIELSDNEAAVNRNIDNLMPTKDVSGVICVDIDSVKIAVSPAIPLNICAEFNLDNAKAQQLKLVKIRKFLNKKKKETYFGFTYEDMVKKAVIPQSVKTSVNGISKVDFVLPSGAAGIYGVYNPLTNQIILFKINGANEVG